MSQRILFYVSGHGYGHARRAAEVMRALVAQSPEIQILVRTTAPAGIFQGIDRSVVCRPEEAIDFGVAEHDALTIDVPTSLQRTTELLGRAPQLVAKEQAFLESHRIDLILADLPYLAGAIGEAAGVPCLAIGNFTWDWIYEPYLAGSAGGEHVVKSIRSMHAKMQGLLRLPFGHPMEAFRQVTDVPLVARHPQWNRDRVLEHIGVDRRDSRPRVLVGMRGGVSDESLRRAIGSSRDLLFLSVQPYPERAPEHFRQVKLDAGLDFTDLLSVCDAIVSKLGYGTVAECIACRTAILWARRTGFREEQVMEVECPRYLRMREIPLEDYRAGQWAEHLQALLRMPQPRESMKTDGAEVCARLILERASH